MRYRALRNKINQTKSFYNDWKKSNDQADSEAFKKIILNQKEISAFWNLKYSYNIVKTDRKGPLTNL